MNIWLGWQLCWSCVLAGLLATPVLSSLLGPPRDNRIHHVIRGLVAHLDRCDGQFLCERMGVGRNRKGLARCVPLDKVRDGHCDCPTCCDEVFNTPGKLCKQSEFRCADGSCVPLNRMCDGVHDCPGYDELKCGGVKECPRKGFRCVSSHQCVPASRVCDGNQDCTCGEDEHSCGCGHMGKSFLIAFTRCPCPEAIPVLYITAAQTTTVTITSARFTPITLGVSRSTRVNLLQNVFPIAPVIDVVSDSTVRITADEPISVVAVVTCEDTSTLMLQEVEGTLIVPEDCASTKYLVEAVSSKSSTNSDTEGQVVIAAYEDNTLVEVTQPNGNKTSTTLQKFQMFYVEGSNLSGSIIKGNKKIAVYSGSQVVRIPLDTSQVSKGVIFEALPPYDSLGRVYVIAALRPRRVLFFRILAATSGTVVSVWDQEGKEIEKFTMEMSEIKEYVFMADDHPVVSVTASEGVLISQYEASRPVDQYGAGDPAVVFLPALTQCDSDIQFTLPDKMDRNILTVVISDYYGIDGLRVDGQPFPVYNPLEIEVPKYGAFTLLFADIQKSFDDPIFTTLTHDNPRAKFCAILKSERRQDTMLTRVGGKI